MSELDNRQTNFPESGDDQKISLRNSRYKQFDYEYVLDLKNNHKKIWSAGGNIRGSDAFTLWGRARQGSETQGVLDWIKEREAWAARHSVNDGNAFVGTDKEPNVSNVAGIVALMKWGVVNPKLGTGGMKKIINELKRKLADRGETVFIEESIESEPNGSNLKLKSKETDMDERTEERHILAVEEDEDSYNVKFAKAEVVQELESNSYGDDEDEEKRFDKDETNYRSIDLSRAEMINEDKRTVRIALSSEEPVERSFGMEVLDHSPESVDMTWARSGNMPVLLDHDTTRQVGIVEDFNLDGATNRTLATVRFGRSELAQETWNDVLDGIKRSVSVGYRINSMVRDESAEDTTYRASWTPMEASLVSLPADTNPMVGVARSKDSAEVEAPVEINNSIKEKKMEENKTPEVDLEAVRSETAVSVRSEVAKEAKEILALATKHNKRDLADVSIAEGHSLEQFRGILLNEIADDKPLETPVAEVGLNDRERSSYSFLNAIRAASSGDWSNAGLEREISNEIAARTGKEARGFYLPMDIGWGQRDQTVGTNSQGGFLKGTEHLANEFIGEVYANSVVAQLGGRVMTGLQGDIAIPKLSASVTNTAFVAEGNAPSEGAATFAQVTMAPKTLATYVDYTRKLALQSDPSVEQILRNDVVQTMASKIDQVALNGGGSNEPSGILQESDTNVVAIGTNGGAVTYAKIVDMEAAIAADNALTGTLNFATTPGVQGAMRQIPRQSSGVEGNFILNDSNSILGHNVTVSTNVPSTLTKGSTSGSCHALILGDFAQVMMGFWSGVDVVVDSSTLSTSGGTRIAFFQDVDVAVRIPNAFAAIKDITV